MNFFEQQHGTTKDQAMKPVKTEKPLARRIINAVEQYLLDNGGEIHGSLNEVADTFAYAHSGVGLDCNPMMLEFVEELGLPFFACGTRIRHYYDKKNDIHYLWHSHFSEC